MQFSLLIGVAVLVSTGCRDDKRHFEPAPKPVVEDENEDEEPDDEDLGPALAGDTSDGDGDGDGDGDKSGSGDDGGETGDSSGDDDSAKTEEGELSRKQAKELLTFLEKELPAGIGAESLFTKLAQQCGKVEVCADGPCRAVLATCSGGDQAGCGSKLSAECPAFAVYAQGATGEALGDKTLNWVKELWGDLLVKVRLGLPDSKADKVDELVEPHGL